MSVSPAGTRPPRRTPAPGSGNWLINGREATPDERVIMARARAAELAADSARLGITGPVGPHDATPSFVQALD